MVNLITGVVIMEIVWKQFGEWSLWRSYGNSLVSGHYGDRMETVW